MKRLLLVLSALCTSVLLQAQLLDWTPTFVKETDGITITMDATKGNQGLLGFAGDVYVHIGAITNKSANADDWKYVPFVWPSTPANGKAVPAGTNKWSYTITGSVRTFFGITDPTETINAIAILFRSGDGNQAQRNADNGNMYVPIYTNNVAVRITAPPFQPKYIREPEAITKSVNDNIAINAISNKAADLKIYLNGTLIQSANGATAIQATPVLTQGGNTTIMVEATEGAVTVKDSVKFFVGGGVNIAPLPTGTKAGINYLSNTSVVLVLEAPDKDRVSVIGEFQGSNWSEQSAYQMNKTPDGKYWWLRIDGLTPGTEYAYQYLVNGSLKIADPYAEKILDPWNDSYITAATYPSLRSYPAGQSGIVSVLQTNATAYTWTNNNFSKPDKRNLFIYELLVRDFVAAHDWKTIKDTLTYLKRLGVNAIELLPFNEFEGNESWGYNPDFYFAPDKYYGPKNRLKEFIDACHSQGIAVIMDIALNHSFGLSPMVQLYWDAANNRPAANNPWFNPVPKHAFNVGYDMNHESTATNYFFSRVVSHWLQEYKIDGFRFDLSKGFTQKQSCDAAGGNCDVGGWSDYDASRIAIWKKYYDTVQLKAAGAYVILEHFAANNEELELSNHGMMLWGNLNHNFSEAAMGWLDNSNFEGGLHTVRGWSNPYLITYMESHDEERMAFRNINYGNSAGAYSIKDTTTSLKRNELCAAFLMGMPGPKMIWQFGELGYDYPINYCPDDGTINDGCRTANKPIRWNYQQQARRQSLYNVYSRMAALRYHGWYKDVFIANNTTIDKNLGGTFKWMTVRSATDSSMICVVGNFGMTAQTFGFAYPKTGVWYDYLNNTAIKITTTAQSVTLQPGEYRVMINRNVNGTPEPPVDPPVVEPGEELTIAVGPNPVTTATVIKINAPTASKAEIILVNSSGKYVAAVYNGNLVAGEQTINWTDKHLSPGVYILKVQTPTVKKSIKLVVR